MIFLGRLVKCTIDKFINITHSGKTESKDCSQFSLTMSWSDIYKFIMKRSCTSYDLDEPEEAEAVLLEGCEHAEDLTEAVKSSACSHPSSSFRSASHHRRSIGIRRAHEDARLRSWRHPLVGRCRTNGVTGWAGDHPVTDGYFLGRLVKCTIDKFINITHSGKTESKDCSQFFPDYELV